MDNVWTNLGNRLETAWKRPTRPNSKRPKDGEIRTILSDTMRKIGIFISRRPEP